MIDFTVLCYRLNFLLLTQQIYCICISAFFKVKKRASNKSKISPPVNWSYFFMLLITCYQALNFINKLQCIKGLKISERTNAFLKSCKTMQSTLKGILVFMCHLILMSTYSHVLLALTF